MERRWRCLRQPRRRRRSRVLSRTGTHQGRLRTNSNPEGGKNYEAHYLHYCGSLLCRNACRLSRRGGATGTRAAIHQFLRFQISDHQTGDSTEIEKTP